MNHILEQKVYFSDTDTYSVVWHGTYLRWIEMGRVEFCQECGKSLTELEELDIFVPVTNINIRYKASAKLEDIVLIETTVSSFNGFSANFHQIVKSKQDGKVFIEADVNVVSVHKNGQLYRKMPEVLAELFRKATQCPQYV